LRVHICKPAERPYAATAAAIEEIKIATLIASTLTLIYIKEERTTKKSKQERKKLS